MKILLLATFLFLAMGTFAQDTPFDGLSSPLQKQLREKMQEQLRKYNPQSLRKDLQTTVHIYINPGNTDMRWLPLDRMPCVIPVLTVQHMPVIQPDLSKTNYHMPVIGKNLAGTGSNKAK